MMTKHVPPEWAFEFHGHKLSLHAASVTAWANWPLLTWASNPNRITVFSSSRKSAKDIPRPA